MGGGEEQATSEMATDSVVANADAEPRIVTIAALHELLAEEAGLPVDESTE